MFGRNKVAMLVAEFLGTALLSTVILSMIGRTSFPFFVAIAAGLTVGVWGLVFGSHLNPAVTLGLWTMRQIQTTVAIVVIAAQMLGGLAAWQLNEYLLNNQLQGIAGDSFDWRVFTAEALGAMVLGLGIAAAAGRALDSGRKALFSGAALTLGVLVASMAANGLLNPAVAVGVQSWSWLYALAPLLGVLVGTSLFGLLFAESFYFWAMPARASKTRAVTKKTTAKRKTAKRK